MGKAFSVRITGEPLDIERVMSERFGGGQLEKCSIKKSNSLAAYPTSMTRESLQENSLIKKEGNANGKTAGVSFIVANC